MSWAKAKRDAEKWLDALHLPKVKGTAVDLSDKGATLQADGLYREMILKAARRILVSRGATHISLPE